MADGLLDITEKQTMAREEAAARTRALADQLARHNPVEFMQTAFDSRQRSLTESG